MGTISFTKDDDYSSRKAAIARQEKLAEMLSQMGAQEQAVFTAGGITAPMSGMGALARGLTSFGGSYLSGKAERDAAALDKASRAEAAAAVKALYTKPGTKGQLRISDEDPGTTAAQMEMNMPTLPGQGPSSEKVQYTLNMPNIPGREMGGGARPYEDQQRMLDELDLSGNPYMARMATGARARIEAENLYKRGRTDTAADLAAKQAYDAGIRGEARTQEIADKTKTPLKPEEVANLGFRPGTVVYTDRFGNISVEQAPDSLSQEAFNQRLRLSAAGRAPQDGRTPTPALLQADARAIAKATEASNAAVPSVQALERSYAILSNPNTPANAALPEINFFNTALSLLGNDAAKQRVTDANLLRATGDIAGIAALAGIGGSDTERELAVATRTAYNPRGTREQNKELTAKKLSAFRFAADYPLLAANWIAKYGSLHPTFKDENGGTFTGYADREYKRIRAEVNAMGGPAAQNTGGAGGAGGAAAPGGAPVPTATDSSGNKVYFRNGQWVNQ
jgi:hypothetical protein